MAEEMWPAIFFPQTPRLLFSVASLPFLSIQNLIKVNIPPSVLIDSYDITGTII